MGDVQPIDYRPLKDDEIRVVELHPWTEAETIGCRLLRMTFDTAIKQKYEALSYEWGLSDSPRTTINIDGITCEVRQNLGSALYHLRKDKKNRRIWIDALCINQMDEKERNHQVTHMGRIYQKATRVVAWLGTESVDDVNAFQYIKDILSRGMLVRTISQLGSTQKNAWFDSHLTKWKDILNLCNRRYWTRLWVVQELALAAQVLLCYDSMTLDARNLQDLIWCITKLEDTYEGVNTEVQNQIMFSPYRKLTFGTFLSQMSKMLKRDEPLLEVIARYSYAECSELRDQIFAVHSLASTCCCIAVPIDYSMSLPELYIKTLVHHLTEHRTDYFIHLSRGLHIRLLADQSLEDEEKTARLRMEECSKVTKTFKISAHGYSGIWWASPSLDSLPEELLEGIMEDIDPIHLSMKLTTSVLEFDAYIQDFVLDESVGHLSDHLDLIEVLDWPVSTEDELTSGKSPHRMEETSAHDRSTICAALERIVRYAERIVRMFCFAAADYKVFFTENGEIRLGPSAVAKGDWCCKLGLLGPDIVIRPNLGANTLDTVGKTVPIMKDLQTRSKYRHKPGLVFDVGFGTLMDISRFAHRQPGFSFLNVPFERRWRASQSQAR